MSAQRVGGRGRRGGFSSLELLISISILSVVIVALGVLGTSGFQAFQGLSHTSEVESDVRRGLDRAARELASLASSTMFQDPTAGWGTEVLDFRPVTGFAGSAATLGSPMRLELEYDPGEVDDGQDNDGDGLVDEGRVILTRNVGAANELRVVICRDVREHLEGELPNSQDDNGNGLVDERGFTIHQVGELMTIRMTVESVNEEHQTVVRTVQTSLIVRN